MKVSLHMKSFQRVAIVIKISINLFLHSIGLGIIIIEGRKLTFPPFFGKESVNDYLNWEMKAEQLFECHHVCEVYHFEKYEWYIYYYLYYLCSNFYFYKLYIYIYIYIYIIICIINNEYGEYLDQSNFHLSALNFFFRITSRLPH